MRKKHQTEGRSCIVPLHVDCFGWKTGGLEEKESKKLNSPQKDEDVDSVWREGPARRGKFMEMRELCGDECWEIQNPSIQINYLLLLLLLK